MNKIVNTFLLDGDKFILEFHLRHPECTSSAYELFTKYCETIQKFKEAGDLNYIYKNEFDKPSFALDGAMLIVKI